MAEAPIQGGSSRGEAHAPTLQQRAYLWLGAFFLASLLVADIVGVKLFRIPLPMPILGFTAIEHTCGMLTFPVTFLLTDLVNEYYGKRAARRLTWIGFTMGIYVFGVLNLSQAMPYLEAPFNVSRESFDAIFGSSKVMFVASLCAFLAGQFADIACFGFIKRLTGQRMVWLRATGSTLVSQLLDSFVVTYLAFDLGRRVFPEVGSPPAGLAHIPQIAVTGYALKFAIAVGITPVIYLGRWGMKRYLGLTPLPAVEG